MPCFCEISAWCWCTHGQNVYCLLCSGLPRGLEKEGFRHPNLLIIKWRKRQTVISASVVINTWPSSWEVNERKQKVPLLAQVSRPCSVKCTKLLRSTTGLLQLNIASVFLSCPGQPQRPDRPLEVDEKANKIIYYNGTVFENTPCRDPESTRHTVGSEIMNRFYFS